MKTLHLHKVSIILGGSYVTLFILYTPNEKILQSQNIKYGECLNF